MGCIYFEKPWYIYIYVKVLKKFITTETFNVDFLFFILTETFNIDF